MNELIEQISKAVPHLQDKDLEEVKKILCLKTYKEAKLLSPEEVSGVLNVNIRTVFKIIRSRDLKASKIRGVFRVTKGNLKKYLKKNELGGQNEDSV